MIQTWRISLIFLEKKQIEINYDWDFGEFQSVLTLFALLSISFNFNNIERLTTECCLPLSLGRLCHPRPYYWWPSVIHDISHNKETSIFTLALINSIIMNKFIDTKFAISKHSISNLLGLVHELASIRADLWSKRELDSNIWKY